MILILISYNSMHHLLRNLFEVYFLFHSSLNRSPHILFVISVALTVSN